MMWLNRFLCALFGHSDVRIFQDQFDPKKTMCVCRGCGHFWSEVES